MIKQIADRFMKHWQRGNFYEQPIAECIEEQQDAKNFPPLFLHETRHGSLFQKKFRAG
jgi:hypothetical protein